MPPIILTGETIMENDEKTEMLKLFRKLSKEKQIIFLCYLRGLITSSAIAQGQAYGHAHPIL